jgi:surface antigen
MKRTGSRQEVSVPPRFGAIGVALLLMLGVLSAEIMTARPVQAATTEPQACSSRDFSCLAGLAPGYNGQQGTWGAETGHNCVGYVAYRLEQNDAPRPWKSVRIGNAEDWDDKATNARIQNPPFVVDKNPEVGSIIQWNDDTRYGEWGHVAYVEWVTASYIWISEDAWGSNAHTAVRRIERSSLDFTQANFIHIKDMLRPASVFVKKVVHGLDGALFVVDLSGPVGGPTGTPARHPIASAATFRCMVASGKEVIDATTAEYKQIPLGSPRPACIAPGEVKGKIVKSAAGTASYFVDFTLVRHWIPEVETYYCLTARGIGLGATDYTDAEVASIPQGADQARCLDPNRAKHHVIRRASDGATWVVDDAGVRHWIPDGETYYCAIARGYPLLASDLSYEQAASLQEGAAYGQCLDPNRAKHHVIRRTDGVAWVVDDAGVRHWIPDGETYYCAIARGYSLFGPAFSYGQAASLREDTSAPYGQCLDPNRAKHHVIRRASDGATWVVDDAGVRHWIPDGETYYCAIARGYSAWGGDLSFAHAASLPETGAYGQCLDPNRVKNHVVRETGGTAYFVDGGGLWHWIPDGGTYLCLVRRYALINNVTWTHINSLRHEGAWATCS